jgi:hypothetical protein
MQTGRIPSCAFGRIHLYHFRTAPVSALVAIVAYFAR